MQLTFIALYSKIKEVPPCIRKSMKEKGDAICSEKDIEYFHKVRETMKEEVCPFTVVSSSNATLLLTLQMTSTLCGADFDTEAKCAGIETHATKDENVDDKSLAVEMMKILEKIL